MKTIREQLIQINESGYRKFNAKLLPGIDNILGVRMPILREMAKDIVKGDWRSFLETYDDIYFEERMLMGLVINYAKCSSEEKLTLTVNFIPKIDNWSVCDSFCFKVSKAEKGSLWRFILPFFTSDSEYEVRFAVVMSLKNFVDIQYLDELFKVYEQIHHDGYYARIATAWAISVCCVKFPELTYTYLQNTTLDCWVVNKSIQKIVESYRVSDVMKARFKTLKRVEI